MARTTDGALSIVISGEEATQGARRSLELGLKIGDEYIAGGFADLDIRLRPARDSFGPDPQRLPSIEISVGKTCWDFHDSVLVRARDDPDDPRRTQYVSWIPLVSRTGTRLLRLSSINYTHIATLSRRTATAIFEEIRGAAVRTHQSIAGGVEVARSVASRAVLSRAALAYQHAVGSGEDAHAASCETLQG